MLGRHPKRLGVVSIALLLMAVGAVGILAANALAQIFFPERLTDAVNRLLQVTTDSTYEVGVGEVEVHLLRRGALASNFRIDARVPDDDAPPHTAPSRLAWRAVIDEIEIAGVSMVNLMVRRRLQANRLRFNAPQVRVFTQHLADTDSSGGDATPGPVFTPARFQADIATRVPQVQFDRIDIARGTFVVQDSVGAVSRLSGIEMVLHSMIIDSTLADSAQSPLYSRSFELSADSAFHTFTTTGYRIGSEMMRVVSEDSTVSVRSTSVQRDTARLQTRGPVYRADRYRFDAARFVAAGLDVDGFFRNLDMVARRAEVDSFRLDVFSDKRRPRRPGVSRPRMPAAILHEAGRRIRIDTIELRQGTLTYSEHAPDGARPGSLAFEDLWATIANVTNDSAQLREDTAATVSANALVAGAARVNTFVTLPLNRPAFNLVITGRLDRMPVQPLNSIVVDLEGIEFTSGTIDSLWFEVIVDSGVATGGVMAVYRDLSVRKLDKRTRESDLFDDIGTLLANAFVVRSNNVPHEDGTAEIGPIEYTRRASDTFFGYLWYALRSGFRALIMR